MDKIEAWNECRTKIPPGKYELTCFKAERTKIWHEGKNGWGKSEKIILWFEVLQGEHMGKVLPMFLPLKLDERGNATGKVPQGSNYWKFWCIANGVRRPQRARLKEMPLSKFTGKVFKAEVVTVEPKWINGEQQPELFHYSRVSILYELLIGDPNS